MNQTDSRATFVATRQLVVLSFATYALLNILAFFAPIAAAMFGDVEATRLLLRAARLASAAIGVLAMVLPWRKANGDLGPLVRAVLLCAALMFGAYGAAQVLDMRSSWIQPAFVHTVALAAWSTALRQGAPHAARRGLWFAVGSCAAEVAARVVEAIPLSSPLVFVVDAASTFLFAACLVVLWRGTRTEQ